MPKKENLFRRIRPRLRNIMLVRVLLFAISIVLSSSGEDFEPYDTTESNVSAPRRSGNASGVGGGSIIEPLAEQAERGLQSSKSAKAKSAKAKSSKIGSKSKAAKSWSKGGKSKSAKGNESSAKSAKSKGSKTKSAKSKASAAKSAKSNVSSAKSAKSKASSAKSKSEKGKSAKSQFSEASEDSHQTKTSNDMEPPMKKLKPQVSGLEDEQSTAEESEVSYQAKSSSDSEPLLSFDEETELSGLGDEQSVAEQLSSTEKDSVYHDSASVEGSLDAQSTSGGVSSNGNEFKEEEMQGVESTGDETASTSPDAIDHEDEVPVSVEINLEGDSVMETLEEENLNMQEDANDQIVNSSLVPNDLSLEEEIEDSANGDTLSLDAFTPGEEEEVSTGEVTPLEAELIEERIEESEAREHLDQSEAVLDVSRESVE